MFIAAILVLCWFVGARAGDSRFDLVRGGSGSFQNSIRDGEVEEKSGKERELLYEAYNSLHSLAQV